MSRISDVRTLVVAGDRWGWVLVLVETEDGLCGIGEASLEGREQTIATCVGELRRVLLGTDPSQIAALNHLLYRDPVWSGGPILQCAISGIDMALWDLKAKRLGVPLYELLGGRTRDDLRLYANGWWYAGGTPDDVGRAARRAIDAGYGGVKFNPFNRQPALDPWHLSPAVLSTAVDYVGAVREAIGPDADLMVDFNACLLNVGDALRAVRALEPFKPAFVEEPLPQENYGAMAELRRRSPLPVAAGERLFSTFDFENLLAAGAVDVAQPDLSHCGGVSAVLAIAARAQSGYVPIAPHNPNGPVCEAATAHIATAVTGCYGLLEHFPSESWRAEVVGAPVTVTEGRMRVSDQPGLGVDLNETAAAARPFASKDLGDFHERNYPGW